MSIEALSMVLRASIRPVSLKLAAVVFADCLNADTGRLNPSMALIAARLVVSRCQAQRIVHRLIAEGLLTVVANGSGGKPGSTPHYRLNLDRIQERVGTGSISATSCSDATGSTLATGINDANDGSHVCSGGASPMNRTGCACETLTSKEPLEKRQEPPFAISSADPLLKPERAAKGRRAKTRVPVGFRASPQVEAWAADKGFDRLEEHTDAFVAKALANGYTYVDWDAALMRAILEDWAKLRGCGRGGTPANTSERATTPSTAYQQTQAYLRSRDMTAEQREASEQARLRAMAAFRHRFSPNRA